MNLLRFIGYSLGLILFPVRFLFFTVHRLLVFTSKPGAKLIVPILVLTFGLLLRSQLDPLLGAPITDAFAGLTSARGDEPGDMIYAWRMEVAFALVFMTLYLGLAVTSKVTTPIVGALPAPRRPLAPMRPITLKEHQIDTVKARVAIRPRRAGFFNGDLSKLNKRLPDRVRALLNESAAGARTDRRQERRQAEAARQAEREGRRQQAEAEKQAPREARQAAQDDKREKRAARRQTETPATSVTTKPSQPVQATPRQVPEAAEAERVAPPPRPDLSPTHPAQARMTPPPAPVPPSPHADRPNPAPRARHGKPADLSEEGPPSVPRRAPSQSGQAPGE